MKKILIVVDVQKDFCPGGSLAVEQGNAIVPIINDLSRSGIFDIVVATQDWHPENHMSFASRYGAEPFTHHEHAGQWYGPIIVCKEVLVLSFIISWTYGLFSTFSERG
jgi:nicotinamidase-related amidase